MLETGITKNKILAELTKSPHGDLKAYLPTAQCAVREEPDFLAHLMAWNLVNGQIRDSKVALPVASLSVPGLSGEYVENSLACLATLSPRDLLRAFRFAKEIKIPGHMMGLRRMVTRYLANREANKAYFDRTAVQHRDSLQELYALNRTSRKRVIGSILFGGEGSKRSGKPFEATPYPRGSVFESIANLKRMSPQEAAGVILEKKIPFLVAAGALEEKIKEPAIALALLERMTPTEFTTNQKLLTSLGVKTVPALRSAYEEAMKRAASSKQNTLKTTKAAEAVEDEATKEKLKALQEKQIKASGGIDGNWLVLGDKSGSMSKAIETSRHVAATLAKYVKGKVWLVFFDVMPRGTEVTGMTYEEIQAKTKGVTANGGTSIGCGLLGMMEANVDVDGIAIVSDGGENTVPFFPLVYTKYCAKFGKTPPVYLYQVEGDPNSFGTGMAAQGHDLQVYDLRGGLDYYSLPNIVQTMRVNRYGLLQQILETKLLTLNGVLEYAQDEPQHITA